MTTYTVWDDKNRKMETFAGPCRLDRWDELPEGWTIERITGQPIGAGPQLREIDL